MAPQDVLKRLKSWAKAAKRDGIALYLAARDPRVPWWVKLMAGAIAAYVVSPIDLIPDFIPVLGLLDEALLVPLAVAALVRLIDPVVFAELRLRAETLAERPQSRIAATVIVGIWLTALGAILWMWLT